MGLPFGKKIKMGKKTTASRVKETKITQNKREARTQADKESVRRYNYKTGKAEIKKAFKTCFILFCFIGFIDYISFKSVLLLYIIAGIFIVIGLGQIINISKKWIRANKLGLLITDDLDIVEGAKILK